MNICRAFSHLIVNMNNQIKNLTTILITEQDVIDQVDILDVSKAYGPDGISPRLIKEGGRLMCQLLQRFFNKSLEISKFPLIWKSANVVPIFKKGNMEEISNYRLISLLCTMSKIFEKIIFKYFTTI